MRENLKIFIGNLDDRTTEDEISELFSQYGPVVSCAVMKRYAFVHMRGPDRAERAIEELNGYELHGKKMLVELSKPRPQNTWKIFVGNVSPACNVKELRAMFEAFGKVVECDVVKDYAFVHMERASDAREAIEKLNGKEIKGKRINVELSNKGSKSTGGNGSSDHGSRSRRPDIRDASLNRADVYNRRRVADAAYAAFALKSPYDRFAGDLSHYDAFESRMRPPSPLFYPRDRSPLRRSPTRSPYGLAQSAATLASKYRAPTSGYGSLSSFGDQAASLSTAFNSQPTALSAAYGNRTSGLSSGYGSQGGYESQSSSYGLETPSSYSTHGSAAYGSQGSSLTSAYGSTASSMAPSYSSQAASNPYASHSAGTSYASSSALASAYRPQQTSAYETSQLSESGLQSAYAALSAPMYERTRLSPPLSSASDSYKKAMDGYKSRLSTDRHFSELAEYRRLSQESPDPFRRSPPKSQLDYRRMTETQSDYPSHPYSEYMRATAMPGYPRRL